MAIGMDEITSDSLTNIFNRIKSLYNLDNVDENRKQTITNQVKKYGYLPYSYIKALEELSEEEVIIALEEKLAANNTFDKNKFVFNDGNISPVKRAGFKNSSWIKTEQHNVKLINLAGLGNGNISKEPGKFIDWLRQIVILPSGNSETGVLSTTIYLIPFHPRDFGCAYLPTSSGVSPNLEDANLKNKLEINAKEQVKLFITLAQLAGHPVMYDVLPQSGRFSKTVLANPHIARWFDIKEMISRLSEILYETGEVLKHEFPPEDINYVRGIISGTLNGSYQEIQDCYQNILNKFSSKLDDRKKVLSWEMLGKKNQEILQLRIKSIINKNLGYPEDRNLSEEDIQDSGIVIKELISQGLWPAPGGAWNSCGIPIFDKMSEGGGYPKFTHYNYKGEDVTEYANLDCQTPFYFVYLESGQYNEEVIDFYIDFLKKIQSEYNFDGFRVDHVDHIVDAFSEKEDGTPISYRAPRYVLGRANNELKKSVPYFAALAEYMLWENFFEEYHQDMNFDLLWGSDIVSQYLKNVTRIIEDNNELAEYNSELEKGSSMLSILKTYNNQDGEFRAIDQYPGQLSEDGALFKWFKFKFLPGGKLCQRPVLYIDGDESFTKTGIEKIIGAEESMERFNNDNFYLKFNAINRFALNNNFTRYGIARIFDQNKDNGFISWYIQAEEDNDERLFIVANENPPTEVFRDNKKDGSVEIINRTHPPIYNIKAPVPTGYNILSEYVLQDNSLDFQEMSVNNFFENYLFYEKIEPSEFHIYKIRRG